MPPGEMPSCFTKDFYAADVMHRLGINLTGIQEIEKMSGNATIEQIAPGAVTARTIQVVANGNTTVFQLNRSTAAKQLYDQLPLSITVENHSDDEKIFYPPRKLDTAGTPKADADSGTLAYYAPWGNVVMFYGRFGSHAGLYELGHAILGSHYIERMAGTITILKKETP